MFVSIRSKWKGHLYCNNTVTLHFNVFRNSFGKLWHCKELYLPFTVLEYRSEALVFFTEDFHFMTLNTPFLWLYLPITLEAHTIKIYSAKVSHSKVPTWLIITAIICYVSFQNGMIICTLITFRGYYYCTVHFECLVHRWHTWTGLLGVALALLTVLHLRLRLPVMMELTRVDVCLLAARLRWNMNVLNFLNLLNLGCTHCVNTEGGSKLTPPPPKPKIDIENISKEGFYRLFRRSHIFKITWTSPLWHRI